MTGGHLGPPPSASPVHLPPPLVLYKKTRAPITESMSIKISSYVGVCNDS